MWAKRDVMRIIEKRAGVCDNIRMIYAQTYTMGVY